MSKTARMSRYGACLAWVVGYQRDGPRVPIEQVWAAITDLEHCHLVRRRPSLVVMRSRWTLLWR